MGILRPRKESLQPSHCSQCPYEELTRQVWFNSTVGDSLLLKSSISTSDISLIFRGWARGADGVQEVAEEAVCAGEEARRGMQLAG